MWIAWTRWWCAELDSGPRPVTVGGFLMLSTMSMSHIQDVDWMLPNKLALVSPRRYPACSSQLSRGGRLFGYVACWFTFFCQMWYLGFLFRLRSMSQRLMFLVVFLDDIMKSGLGGVFLLIDTNPFSAHSTSISAACCIMKVAIVEYSFLHHLTSS